MNLVRGGGVAYLKKKTPDLRSPEVGIFTLHAQHSYIFNLDDIFLKK